MVIAKRLIVFLLLLLSLKAEDVGVENLSLDEAINIMKQSNLELKISKFNEQIKEYEAEATKGYKLGTADVIVEDAYSNDAGNVFGFKLKSREATFGDLGLKSLWIIWGWLSREIWMLQGECIATSNRLNHSSARNHFQTTFYIYGFHSIPGWEA